MCSAGIPDSLGVPAGCTQDTLSSAYNDLDSVREQFFRYGEEIAAIIVEPVAANMGVVEPKPGFLQGLREICDEYGALLIFDEVITGFRLGIDGAQGYYKVCPDLTTFGKIIGAGMPVGAYGGKREVMESVAPVGGVYQAGTLSGNPVAMAAGYAQLSILKENPSYYTRLNETADAFYGEMAAVLQDSGLPWQVNHVGSLGCLYFTEEHVVNYESAKTSDTKSYADYCNYMIGHGIYLAPAQFEAMFVSMAHTKEQLDQALSVMKEYMNTLK